MSRSDDKLTAEQPWLKQAVNELRQPVVPSIAGQLRAARRTALTQQQASGIRQRWLTLGFPVRAALMAGVAVVAVVSVIMPGLPTKTVEPLPSLQAKATGGGDLLLEDLSMMAAQDDLQFYQDLEFLQWLDEEAGLDTQS